MYIYKPFLVLTLEQFKTCLLKNCVVKILYHFQPNTKSDLSNSRKIGR